MKFYVASKFENKEMVRAVMARLQSLGHTVTFDWTVHDAAGKSGQELAEYLEMCAVQDACGVASCDVLFLIDHPSCRGAYTELGIALGLDRTILVVKAVESPFPGMKQNIFMHMPCVKHFNGIDEAFDHLATLAPVDQVVRPQ